MKIDERVIPGVSDTFNLQRHIARYNLILGELEGKNVLDLACGTGYGSFLMSQVASFVEGVDIDKEAIEFAQTFYVSPTLSFKQSDILKYDHDPVDVIISFETVEHIKDLKKLEKKFLTLLKTGGKLIYSVPLYENYDNPYHVHKFTINEALSLFPSFKLRDIAIQDGLNFSGKDEQKPFTYLIVSKVKI
jgi:2-polyprenyl-3-methyl-5-hydroxy-6-metoxy-1,4-benzoquinol methylase